MLSNLGLHGLPVPSGYGAPGYPAVEENTRLKLQVFRLGEVLLASCACEAQVDLILNLESRANTVPGDMALGYDWSSECSPTAAGYDCQGRAVTTQAYDRMVAQVRNDAAGWDAPENAATADGEPADPALIKGNFTHEELPSELGFALPIGIGHGGDYNGYTVSYREYMSRDHYRKALTAYGPHTADYMVTRLVRMAGSLKGGPALQPEPHDTAAAADEARQEALARAIGAASGPAYDAWRDALPADVGPVDAVQQPVDLERFGAATFTWRGGSNAVDNPVVRVEREVDGAWQPYADTTGEVQTQVAFPLGVQGVADTYTGSQEWLWTAGFEAFSGFPAPLRLHARGPVPLRRRRRLAGQRRRRGVRPDERALRRARRGAACRCRTRRSPAGRRRSSVPDSAYPRSYASTFRTIADDGRTTICRTCSFRPWAATASAASAVVTVTRASGEVERVPAELVDGRWTVPLEDGDRAVVEPGAVTDALGNVNGTALVLR